MEQAITMRTQTMFRARTETGYSLFEGLRISVENRQPLA